MESDENKSSGSDVEEADDIGNDENDVNESEDDNVTEVKGEVETFAGTISFVYYQIMDHILTKLQSIAIFVYK